MKMRIDCYSKEEFGIGLVWLPDDELPKNEPTDLVLFASYTLRQLSNLGGHPAAKALDGYLVSKEHFNSLLGGKPIYPLASQLISDLRDQLEAGAPNSSRFVDGQLQINRQTLDLLDEKVLTPMPKLVNLHGHAKKSFELDLLHMQLQINGFGALFGDLHFYIYQSVLVLAQFLVKKRKNDEAFLIYLSEIAPLCGEAHILDQITMRNQMELAIAIVDKVGALKHYQG